MLRNLFRTRASSEAEYAAYSAQYTYGPSGEIFTGDSVLRYPDYLYHRDIENHLATLSRLDLPVDEAEVKASVKPLTRAATVQQILTRAPKFLADDLEGLSLESSRRKSTQQVTFLENLTWWIAHENLSRADFAEVFALEPQVRTRTIHVLRQLVASIETALRSGNYSKSLELTKSEVDRLNVYLRSLPKEESRRVAAVVNLYHDLSVWNATYVVTNLTDIRSRLLRLKTCFEESGISPETAWPDSNMYQAYLELSTGLS